jgi:hypothetical protein
MQYFTYNEPGLAPRLQKMAAMLGAAQMTVGTPTSPFAGAGGNQQRVELNH